MCFAHPSKSFQDLVFLVVWQVLGSVVMGQAWLTEHSFVHVGQWGTHDSGTPHPIFVSEWFKRALDAEYIQKHACLLCVYTIVP